jgi:hypothetical protein
MQSDKQSIHKNDSLPSDCAWLFPEYDFEQMDLRHYEGVIIERILERGSWEQLRWLFTTFGENKVAKWVREHGFRLLSKRSFALWKLALDIEEYKAPEWAIEGKNLAIW